MTSRQVSGAGGVARPRLLRAGRVWRAPRQRGGGDERGHAVAFQFRGSLSSCWYCETFRNSAGAVMQRWLPLYGARRVTPAGREWSTPGL